VLDGWLVSHSECVFVVSLLVSCMFRYSFVQKLSLAFTWAMLDFLLLLELLLFRSLSLSSLNSTLSSVCNFI
jgi:hypothetical protein